MRSVKCPPHGDHVIEIGVSSLHQTPFLSYTLPMGTANAVPADRAKLAVGTHRHARFRRSPYLDERPGSSYSDDHTLPFPARTYCLLYPLVCRAPKSLSNSARHSRDVAPQCQVQPQDARSAQKPHTRVACGMHTTRVHALQDMHGSRVPSSTQHAH